MRFKKSISVIDDYLRGGVYYIPHFREAVSDGKNAMKLMQARPVLREDEMYPSYVIMYRCCRCDTKVLPEWDHCTNCGGGLDWRLDSNDE